MLRRNLFKSLSLLWGGLMIKPWNDMGKHYKDKSHIILEIDFGKGERRFPDGAVGKAWGQLLEYEDPLTALEDIYHCARQDLLYKPLDED